jgi:CheY-like chemotaxis protein
MGAECKVLLVEDNPDVANATEELLQRISCLVEIVRDAAAALNRASCFRLLRRS